MSEIEALPAIQYRIRPCDPAAHLFEIALTVPDPIAEGQRFSLPAWIPGSYMIREFARHVVQIQACRGTRPIGLTQIDKHTWQAQACAGEITLRYRVYAWDLSVRTAHLDQSHGFFNGTSVFLRVHDRESRACELLIEPPEDPLCADWRVATTLTSAGAPPHGFGRYLAKDYDALIDHPVEMGKFELVEFDACGVPHQVAITDGGRIDADRLARDLKAVCETQIRLFEPRERTAPFGRYLFLTMAVGNGYGGLEHRDSTALLCARSDLPWPDMKGTPDGYRRFLGLASHEYFHSWHVKRIKPQAFVTYDLGRENHTRLLWVFEGFTSYYDDLMLLRAGVIGREHYLGALRDTIASVLRSPGRLSQSVAASSFDAWTKYYRQDENSPNTIVSYYAKGALIALCLDLSIRARTDGKYSLDDVMRLLWQRYGRSFDHQAQGLSEDGLPELVREATTLDLSSEIVDWSEKTAELPLSRLLAVAGVRMSLSAAEPGAAWLGARLQTRGNELVIGTALQGGPSQVAGLSAGDVIVAIDGLRIDERGLKTLLERRRPGAVLNVHAFRRDALISRAVTLGEAPKTEPTLRIDAPAGSAAEAILNGWLGRERIRKPRR